MRRIVRGLIMAWHLAHRVLNHAPDALTPQERLLLAVIAEETPADRPDAAIPVVELARRTGLTPSGVGKVLRRLAARDMDVRVAIGKTVDGAPLYAHHGRVTRFRLPVLPVDPSCSSCQRSPDRETFPDPTSPRRSPAREGIRSPAREGIAAEGLPNGPRRSPDRALKVSRAGDPLQYQEPGAASSPLDRLAAAALADDPTLSVGYGGLPGSNGRRP